MKELLICFLLPASESVLLKRDRDNVLKLCRGEEGIKEFWKIHFLQPAVRQK